MKICDESFVLLKLKTLKIILLIDNFYYLDTSEIFDQQTIFFLYISHVARRIVNDFDHQKR